MSTQWSDVVCSWQHRAWGAPGLFSLTAEPQTSQLCFICIRVIALSGTVSAELKANNIHSQHLHHFKLLVRNISLVVRQQSLPYLLTFTCGASLNITRSSAILRPPLFTSKLLLQDIFRLSFFFFLPFKPR